jgi:hypothetical protein
MPCAPRPEPTVVACSVMTDKTSGYIEVHKGKAIHVTGRGGP